MTTNHMKVCHPHIKKKLYKSDILDQKEHQFTVISQPVNYSTDHR